MVTGSGFSLNTPLPPPSIPIRSSHGAPVSCGGGEGVVVGFERSELIQL